MDERIGHCSAGIGQRLARRTFTKFLFAAAAGAVLAPRSGIAARRRLPPQIVWAATDFEPLVGSRFELADSAMPGDCLWLESVTEVGRPGFGGPSGRAPFSLEFTGRPEGPRDQATYRLRHPVAGEITLLLAPIDRPGDVPRFQAIVG